MDLKGRVALVIGAGSGMGRATVRRLTDEGMQVRAVDVNGDAVRAIADEIDALAVTCDARTRNSSLDRTARSTCRYAVRPDQGRARRRRDGYVDDRVTELVARFTAPDACLSDLFCDAHDPDAAAFTLVHEDLSRDTLTYGGLRERSERVAAGLSELGVSAGDAVATLMNKSASYFATVVGIWRIGAVHVPLFTAFAPPAIAMRSKAARPRSW